MYCGYFLLDLLSLAYNSLSLAYSSLFQNNLFRSYFYENATSSFVIHAFAYTTLLSLYLFAASSTLTKRNKNGKMFSKLSFKTKEDYTVIEVMKY